MVSSPKSGGGGQQAQPAQQAPPAGAPGMAPPGAQGMQAGAPGGMDPAVKMAMLRQMLAQAQTPAMGYNPAHNMRGGGGTPASTDAMSPVKVASDIVGALKGNQPLLFMVVLVVLLNGAFLGLIYYANNARQEREHTEHMALLERCFPKGEPP